MGNDPSLEHCGHDMSLPVLVGDGLLVLSPGLAADATAGILSIASAIRAAGTNITKRDNLIWFYCNIRVTSP